LERVELAPALCRTTSVESASNLVALDNMNMLQPFTVWTGAALALGLFTPASPAQTVQRLTQIVQRATATEGQTGAAEAKTFRIAGSTLDADGKPLAGVVVDCFRYAGGQWPPGAAYTEDKQRVTTGANGAFEFKVSPATTVVLARKPGLAPAWMQYWNLTKDSTDERLVLTPPTTLAGVVADEADKPVADAEVSVSVSYLEKPMENGRMSFGYLSGKSARECFSARTGADGKFVIQGFPTNATADLAVSKPGRVLREPQRDYVSPDTMRCRSGQQDIKLVVEPAGGIEGKVVAQETGQPLTGMQLRLRPTGPGYFGGREREPSQSGADGAFRIADLAAGTYQVHATFGTNLVPEWVAEWVSVTVELGQTAKDVKVSATRGGFLEVMVLGKDDRKPVENAGINASKEGYYGNTTSGTNGIALLRLPPGEYHVAASQEKARSEGSTATVVSGRTNRLEIELNPPPRITGVVRDPSGAVVPGLQLSVSPNWGHNTGEVKTDAQGHYEMSWAPQQIGPSGTTFCLIARDVAHNLAAAQDIEEGTKILDLKLESGLVVAGRVADVNGKPLSNATVQVFLWSGNSGSQFEDKPIRTDARGRFEMTAMPPGRKYSMDATAKGYGSANQSIQENADTNRIELEPCVLRVADRKLAGEVVDAEDKPAARVNVYMYGQGQPQGSVRTDEKGRFKFDAVCQGTIQLSANSQRSYGNARAEAGDTNVVIRLGVNQSFSSRPVSKRPSLKGKPLPDLAAVELGSEAAPAGKPLLLCLFDLEQRPSRRFVKQLTEQYDDLREKGLTVLGLQAAVTTAASFREWKDANLVAFPVGRVAEKADKTKWASDVESLPWLILVDAERRVAAEGFALDELDAKLKALTK
jgi:protocatechuate 3,4-dioxygenase beta subunit